ncbi:MAG: hypothetical protein RLY89_823 [Bacteroidota bacterium]|jgi:hypothetical protein
MKFFPLLVLSCFSFANIQAQNLDSVINKFEATYGGREKLKALSSMQMESVLKLSIMGQALEINLNTVKENGKLFRRDMAGIMGMGSSYTLVTDTAGWAYIPSLPAFGGSEATKPALQKMSPEELVGQQFEMDCSGPFGPLVDYAAKGNKAELLGIEKVDKQDCYNIKLTLKSGQFIQYLISTADYHVLQVSAVGDMAGNLTGFAAIMKMMGNGRGKKAKTSIQYRKYMTINGVLFPMEQVISFGPIETVISIQSVQFNQPIDKMFYRNSK